MIKNSFISVISQKENEKSRGSVEFQVFSFTTNKIRRLTSHLELHKKDFISERFPENFGKTLTAAELFVKKKYKRYKQLIGEFDILEIKTR